MYCINNDNHAQVAKSTDFAKSREAALQGKRKVFDIPEDFPEMKEVMAAIPEKCFEKNTIL